MKCCNCNTEIPPEWKHAINQNSCPACGGALMNDAMKELLEEIRTALAAMPNDAEGLAGWLLSNYELRKVGSGEPVQKFFGDKPLKEDGDGRPLKIADSAVQKFFKQAGVKIPPKRKNISELVESINSEESEAEELEGNDDYVHKAVEVMNQGGGLDPSLLKKLKAQNSSLNEPESNDGADLHPALQFERMERLKKQQDLQLGGSVGKIRRSE